MDSDKQYHFLASPLQERVFGRKKIRTLKKSLQYLIVWGKGSGNSSAVNCDQLADSNTGEYNLQIALAKRKGWTRSPQVEKGPKEKSRS